MVAVARAKKSDGAFGRRLRELREAAGLTLAALGERAGMSYQNVARLERGDRDPTWPTLIRLADALGVGLDAFRDPRVSGRPPAPEPRATYPASKRK